MLNQDVSDVKQGAVTIFSFPTTTAGAVALAHIYALLRNHPSIMAELFEGYN